MPRRTYTRDDVQTHGTGYAGPSLPAVNIKVYGTLRDAWSDFEREESPDEGFTLDWIEENLSDDTFDALFWNVCAAEFEYLVAYATTDEDAIFPAAKYGRLSIEQEGRSGGWAVVDGLPDVDEWDAILLARWRKFERIAREITEGVPFQMLASIYLNHWEWERDEEIERTRAANMDVATVAR